jgi:hypothetical protein
MIGLESKRTQNIIDRIKKAEKPYLEFVRKFPHAKTLSQIMEDENIPGLEWLDRSVLKRKIEKAIATSGIEKITFNFWVPTKEREDQKKWGEIKKYQGDLPMGMVGYSQIRPFWGTGEKRSRGKLHLRPLSMFVGTWMREEDRLIYERKGIDIESAIGRKMYNIPEVFQTNKRVATEIFINEIIHDMFHFNLPMIALKKELLHKAVTDYCLFDKGQLPEKDPWDQFVLDAMTNPYFFLQSSETYPVPKNSVQAAFIKKMRGWYNSPKKPRKLLALWGYENPTEKQIEERILTMIKNGCKQYEGDKLPVYWDMV